LAKLRESEIVRMAIANGLNAVVLIQRLNAN
jgi:hypothetical protein